MKKNYYLYLFIILFSCSKEQVGIDVFQSVDVSEHIVFDGFATTYYGDQFISISKSTGLVADQTNPVLDAEIVIYSKDSLYEFELYDTTGIYCSVKPFAIERGIKYTCKVIVEGKEYLASDSLSLYNDNEKDTLLLPSTNEITDQGDNIVIWFYKQNFGYEQTSCYQLGAAYYTYETAYYKNLNIGEFLFKDRAAFIYHHKGSLPQGVYANSFTLNSYNVSKNSFIEYFYFDISKEYADFLIDYFNITEWNGGIFSTIPGNAFTNVSNDGLGKFFVADVKRIQINYKDYLETFK